MVEIIRAVPPCLQAPFRLVKTPRPTASAHRRNARKNTSPSARTPVHGVHALTLRRRVPGIAGQSEEILFDRGNHNPCYILNNQYTIYLAGLSIDGRRKNRKKPSR